MLNQQRHSNYLHTGSPSQWLTSWEILRKFPHKRHNLLLPGTLSLECLLPFLEQTSGRGTILTHISPRRRLRLRGEINSQIKSQPQAHVCKMNHFFFGPHIYLRAMKTYSGVERIKNLVMKTMYSLPKEMHKFTTFKKSNFKKLGCGGEILQV